jgi:opacity protein-like surface antigen
MRGTLAIVTFGAGMLVSAVASAQSSCPDGWFCEQETPTEADSGDEPEAEPEASEGAPAEAAPRAAPVPAASTPKPTIIVVRQENAPRPPKKRRRSEWGVNLRLQGVLMDEEDRDEDAEMGGLGVSLRYRPIPHFAFDVGLDVLGGTDWAGHERRETALLLSGMVFFNPRSKVQVYTLGGIGFSGARVELEQTYDNGDGTTSTETYDEEYRYFGAHIGGGLEFRLSRKVALNLDIIGFIRGRTDDLADEQPEFVEAGTGRTTNTSGGGLGRAGLTIYW